MLTPFKSNKSFYSKPHPILHHLFHIFIKGDIIILPLLLLIFLSSLLSIKVMLISYGVYVSVRYFGEIIYWLLQQFGDKKYRPSDFGLKNLDNNAIYIIYQLIAIIWVTLGICLIIFSIIYL